MTWRPRLGAIPEADGTRFRVIAPRTEGIEVVIETPDARAGRTRMKACGGGLFEAFVPGARAGDRYRLALAGQPPYPDPASRHQPDGVHGPSAIVNPKAFAWSDDGWRGVTMRRLSIYELHVGTFSPEGTFAGAAAKLPWLRELGVTAIELMPIADFPGDRNWGYDGGALFAPARCYGSPDDLRHLVNEAHRAGLAVHLDVVYNHFGPDGAYAAAFCPDFFSSRHESPWGSGINLDGERCDIVRDYFIENALHWIHEYRLDGLRLDATHAMVDDGPRHFLAELSARVRDSVTDREVLLIAEDARNLAHIVKPEGAGGWAMDGVWSDDFHHALRAYLTGDHDGYFADFTGSTDELAAVLQQGWYFTGQESVWTDGPRGTDPEGIRPERFVVFTQNHDQVGNRVRGDRLNHAVDMATYRAVSTLLLTAPQTPLLFMGQEWAAGTPFRFFTHHGEPLGAQVTAGRRQEFGRFDAYATADAIPDPQSDETFEASRLDWSEAEREPHAGTARLYRRLLALRVTHPVLGARDAVHRAVAAGDDGVVVDRATAGAVVRTVVRLQGKGPIDVPSSAMVRTWHALASTEDADVCLEPAAIRWEETPGMLRITFVRPGAIVLEGRRTE